MVRPKKRSGCRQGCLQKERLVDVSDCLASSATAGRPRSLHEVYVCFCLAPCCADPCGNDSQVNGLSVLLLFLGILLGIAVGIYLPQWLPKKPAPAPSS